MTQFQPHAVETSGLPVGVGMLVDSYDAPLELMLLRWSWTEVCRHLQDEDIFDSPKSTIAASSKVEQAI
jgi:hypothetical protein